MFKQDNELFQKLEKSIESIQKIVIEGDESRKLYVFYYDEPPRENEVLRLHVSITKNNLSPLITFYYPGYVSLEKSADGTLTPKFEFSPDENLKPKELLNESENVDWKRLVDAVKKFCNEENSGLL